MDPNLIIALSIVQMILYVILFGSFIYNLFSKKKSWGFTIIILFFLILINFYEDDVLDHVMFDQTYSNEFQQQQSTENYYQEKFQQQTTTVFVSSVLDGDTIKLSTGNIIRLIGLNAPESGQSCSSDATAKLKELVLRKEITLEKDVEDKDRYNRLLRYVYIDDTFVNLEMVRLGFAHKYEYGSNTRYSSQFKQAENEAKQNKSCLWKSEEVKYIQDKCIHITNFHFNAGGDDNYNLNDEYITFENKCSYSISMSRWTIKDETASHIYIIQQFTFQPKKTVTLYSGTGTNTNSALYWGRTSGDYAAIWNNGGDTLFIRDSNGNLVLSQSYSGY